MSNPIPDAIVMTAPDGCTKYLVHAVARSLEHMAPEAVLEVPCTRPGRSELTDWCLDAGRRPLNPHQHDEPLFIRNARRPATAGAA